MGNGLDHDVALGPLVNEDGLGKVIDSSTTRSSKGAKVLTGGKPPSGPGYLLSGDGSRNVLQRRKDPQRGDLRPGRLDPDFKTEDEVITRANDTEYGLVAYLYTRDLAAACAWRSSSTSA